MSGKRSSGPRRKHLCCVILKLSYFSPLASKTYRAEIGGKLSKPRSHPRFQTEVRSESLTLISFWDIPVDAWLVRHLEFSFCRSLCKIFACIRFCIASVFSVCFTIRLLSKFYILFLIFVWWTVNGLHTEIWHTGTSEANDIRWIYAK